MTDVRERVVYASARRLAFKSSLSALLLLRSALSLPHHAMRSSIGVMEKFITIKQQKRRKGLSEFCTKIANERIR